MGQLLPTDNHQKIKDKYMRYINALSDPAEKLKK
jgi:hypothetical protein